jgi:formylmethanofuran dehydrogenase subunit C
MGRGALVIDGDVGCELGRMMQGGTISVSGSAGTDAGLAMAGGTIMIAGDAGDRLAGPLPGASRGMTGGEILVRGHAGRDAACAVRRGLVVIGAIAGSPGEWNKRGSIVTIGGASVPPTYRYACTYRPPYLALLHHYLRSRGWPIDERIATGRFARYCGDVSQLARGELLAWADKASA